MSGIYRVESPINQFTWSVRNMAPTAVNILEAVAANDVSTAEPTTSTIKCTAVRSLVAKSF